jgi:hypothetical protein
MTNITELFCEFCCLVNNKYFFINLLAFSKLQQLIYCQAYIFEECIKHKKSEGLLRI